MNKERSQIGVAASAVSRAVIPAQSRASRLGLTAALGASLVLCGPDAPHAQQRQRREPEVTVTGINAGGNTVSISASGSLNRAQTWQDSEGFHVVLPNGQTALGGTARGVKVRRVGNSLELVVPVRSGASVTVLPRGERLDLVMNGGGPEPAAPEPAAREEARAGQSQAQERAARRQGRAAEAAVARRQNIETLSGPAPQPRPERQRPTETPAPEQSALAGGAPKPAVELPAPPVAAGAGGENPPAPEAAATPPAVELPAPPANLEAGASLGSLIFSLPSLLALFGLGLLGALFAFLRLRRKDDDAEPQAKGAVKADAAKKVEAEKKGETEAASPFTQLKGDRRQANVAVPFERRHRGPGAEDQASREQRTLEGRSEPVNPALPAVTFGAYRIDQEVALLVAGQPHSVEVISSRAPDDRRALATSLQKALRAPDVDEDGRRRARMALEDYGFVARECASLLLGAESFERASAASALGEMRSAQALPFLTEALYDHDSVVRMAAVQSLGDLGLPSAIGALLDTARHHPEIPASVIGPVLTACSVETLEPCFESPASAHAGEEHLEEFAGDVRMIAPQPASFEELPDWLEDETLAVALGLVSSHDADERTHAAQALAQFQVRRAVEALSHLATRDEEAAVRAAAVTSLGLINHESVFVPVIVGMGDSAREVRAAAARSLSRLSFDRADAYARVCAAADDATLAEVARACVSTGLAAQAINRLASRDRRQGYEAYSLLSLVVKAGETQTLVDAIECHRDTDVRLACVGLLAQSREPGLAERLQLVAQNTGVPKRVRDALHETLTTA
jgi:HEAT repeat protein